MLHIPQPKIQVSVSRFMKYLNLRDQSLSIFNCDLDII